MDRHALAARIMVLREVRNLFQQQSAYDRLAAFACEKPVEQELARYEARLALYDAATRKVG